jgi:hypothetical protein
MLKHFKISPLPNKISPWLISLLQWLTVREQLRELHMTTKLEPGGDGKNTASPSDAATFTFGKQENILVFGAFCHGYQIRSIPPEKLAEGAVRSTISHVVLGDGQTENPTKDVDHELSILLSRQSQAFLK